jgi:hypothetical protein
LHRVAKTINLDKKSGGAKVELVELLGAPTAGQRLGGEGGLMRKLRFKLSVLILSILVGVPAFANSVSYTFTTSIMVGSTPQSFSGQMTWDPLLLIKATSFAFSFNGANVASCSSGSCPLLAALFGSGNYLVGIAGPLKLNNQSFLLAITDPTIHVITLQQVNVIWAVPEVASGVQLVIVAITLICAVFRSPLLRRPA